MGFASRSISLSRSQSRWLSHHCRRGFGERLVRRGGEWARVGREEELGEETYAHVGLETLVGTALLLDVAQAGAVLEAVAVVGPEGGADLSGLG